MAVAGREKSRVVGDDHGARAQRGECSCGRDGEGGRRALWRRDEDALEGTGSSRRAGAGHSQGARREPPTLPSLDAADSGAPFTRTGCIRNRRPAHQTPLVLPHVESA
ncbi:hypothetical protein GUJ93_ZPchr0008g12238 [Zizania palustris]|uniref:Uncharacterized protein n=1 Tax=Zizania palustris TaxID=103762 RepID=A0A8J5V5H2_ZIZPA|nr:hypothetical protein GUJ93_ZPchr0008g12238 [Zizania palustris]